VVHEFTPTENEKAKLFTPISFFPRSRGKMKKGDRKESSDFDGSTYRIFERVHWLVDVHERRGESWKAPALGRNHVPAPRFKMSTRGVERGGGPSGHRGIARAWNDSHLRL
jgi:hypothetical protein